MGEPFKLSESEGAHGVKTKFLLRPISFFVDSSRHPAGRLGDGHFQRAFTSGHSLGFVSFPKERYVKKIGVIFGMETTFPPALVDKINFMNERSEEHTSELQS